MPERLTIIMSFSCRIGLLFSLTPWAKLIATACWETMPLILSRIRSTLLPLARLP